MKILLACFMTLTTSLLGAQEVIHKDPISGITIPGEFDLVSFKLKIGHTGCFGPCSVYNLTLSGDGVVLYDGIKYVEVKGEQSKRVSIEIVKSILSKLYESKFFYYPNEYRNYSVDFTDSRATVLIQEISDISKPYIEVSVGDFKKMFIVTPSAPLEARKLIGEIEGKLNISSWVETANQSLQQMPAE